MGGHEVVHDGLQEEGHRAEKGADVAGCGALAAVVAGDKLRRLLRRLQHAAAVVVAAGGAWHRYWGYFLVASGDKLPLAAAPEENLEVVVEHQVVAVDHGARALEAAWSAKRLGNEESATRRLEQRSEKMVVEVGLRAALS